MRPRRSRKRFRHLDQQHTAQSHSHSAERTPETAKQPSIDHASMDVIGLQSVIGNQAVQRQIADSGRGRGAFDPTTMDVIGLQNVIGNQAVQRLMVQRRAAVNSTSAGHTPFLNLQRCSGKANCSCGCGGSKSAADSGDELQAMYAGLQRRMTQAAEQAAGQALSSEITRTRAYGRTLDPAARRKLEPAMGADLSGVRIHDDADADRLARSVQAEAFTTGSDIYFQSGAYDPHSERGMHLLAHELTHTVQQGRGSVSGVQMSEGVMISNPSDQYEQEAESNANRVMSAINDRSAGTKRAATQIGSRSSSTAVQRSLVIQRQAEPNKVFEDTQPGWVAKFDPQATLTPDEAGLPSQVAQYSKDANNQIFHQHDFEIGTSKSGTLDMFVGLAWQRIGGQPKPGEQPVDPNLLKICDPCNFIPTPPYGQSQVDECQELDGRALRKIFVKQLLQDMINDPCQFIENDVARVLCGLGNVAIDLIPGVAQVRNTANRIITEVNNIESKNPLCKNVPLKPKPKVTSDTGTGTVQMRLRYALDENGNMQITGAGPLTNANGSGAQVQSPVQHTKQPQGTGAFISVDPAIISNISAPNANNESVPQVHQSQHSFGVNLRQPKPPPDVQVKCSDQLKPFKINSDQLEKEDKEIETLFDWWSCLPPVVQEQVSAGDLPVIAEGFASRTGGNALNLTLAQKRAEKGKKFMESFAGSKADITTFAFGEELAPDEGVSPPKEDAEMRRTDIKVEGVVPGKLAGDLTDETACGANATHGEPFNDTRPRADVDCSVKNGKAPGGEVPITQDTPAGEIPDTEAPPGFENTVEETPAADTSTGTSIFDDVFSSMNDVDVTDGGLAEANEAVFDDALPANETDGKAGGDSWMGDIMDTVTETAGDVYDWFADGASGGAAEMAEEKSGWW